MQEHNSSCIPQVTFHREALFPLIIHRRRQGEQKVCLGKALKRPPRFLREISRWIFADRTRHRRQKQSLPRKYARVGAAAKRATAELVFEKRDSRAAWNARFLCGTCGNSETRAASSCEHPRNNCERGTVDPCETRRHISPHHVGSNAATRRKRTKRRRIKNAPRLSTTRRISDSGQVEQRALSGPACCRICSLGARARESALPHVNGVSRGRRCFVFVGASALLTFGARF